VLQRVISSEALTFPPMLHCHFSSVLSHVLPVPGHVPGSSVGNNWRAHRATEPLTIDPSCGL
jgi:hypothetical protein